MAVYHRLPLAAALTESQSVHDTINKQHNIHMLKADINTKQGNRKVMSTLIRTYDYVCQIHM